MTLSEICKENHYPIIFIGSGMSRRYLKDFPIWTDLLEDYWDKLGMEGNYFSYLHQLTQHYQNDNHVEEDFFANTTAASKIEAEFDKAFFEEKIVVDGLSIRDAQQKRISPFKKDLANRFSSYSVRDDIDPEEFQLFSSMLQKARIIVTTNYDKLIEDSVTDSSDQRPSIYLGADGLFNSDNGWSEIYKIHGDVSKSNSIVITADDYKKYDDNSLLVSAKLMSAMIDTPIIFFGYSLTDRNVLKILDDFALHIPNEDPRKSANRIFVVEYHPEFDDNKTIEEIARDDAHHGMNYTLVKTKKFNAIFKELSSINEGATPYEVRKYTSLIKKLIVKKGAEGTLDATLVSPNSLEQLNGKIDDNKPIVVAMGDVRSIMVMPDLINYVEDYVTDQSRYEPAVALTFAARQGNSSTRIPFALYWNKNDKSSLHLSGTDWKKLNEKVKNEGTIALAKASLVSQARLHHESLQQILDAGYTKTREIEVVSWNSTELPIKDVDTYIRDNLELFKTSVLAGDSITSPFRRLLVLRDLIVNGEMHTWDGYKA
jgi:hypothetical protein